ncbi:MAG TPA: hypothetical protein VFZ19_00945 [Solirubrobacterales bacterium]
MGKPPDSRKPPHLHSVGSPEPSDEGPPPTTKEGAEIERQRVETDGIRSEIRNNEKLTDAGVKSIEADTEETRNERIFFRRMIAVGVVLSVISPIAAVLTGEPWFFTGNGMGAVLTGGGLRRLSVLTSSRPLGARPPAPAG